MLAARRPEPDDTGSTEEVQRHGYGRLPVPWWVTIAYLGFLAWTVFNVHYPALFIGGFLFFVGFDRATAAYSTLTDFKTPLLVGFSLGGSSFMAVCKPGGSRQC